MATVKSNGVKKALLVMDASTKQQIDLPLNAAEAIMAPIVNLQTWINSRIRTGGKGKVEIGGKVWYYAYPKQTKNDRDIETSVDSTTGKITGGMYGASSANTFGYIAPTGEINLVKDYIEPVGAKFLKHLFTKSDLKDESLKALVGLKLADYTAEVAEDNLLALKTALVASVGTTGKFALDAGFTATATGAGKRVKAFTYDGTAGKDGEQAINDIIAALTFKSKIGLKDGVETSYPFARGINVEASTIIDISPSLNTLILKAVEKSQNGFLANVGVDTEKGLVKYISFLGKSVKVEVISDMPAKGGKAFNFLIEEVGKHGAIAMPNRFNGGSLVRPHSEGMTMLGTILEAVGLVAGLKTMQPELNFGSFEV